MYALFWGALTGLLVYAGLRLRLRIRERRGSSDPAVDDDAVRTILETGRLVTSEDAPLDLEEIEEEERRFWSETWDEPDEW